MSKKCLYCYEDLIVDDDSNTNEDFHSSCGEQFFGTELAPVLDYSIDEMAKLAKEVVENSISVPGVQPKLSLGLIKEILNDKEQGRLTILGALDGNYILKPQNEAYPQMPENEHLTMRMAFITSL